ncbi:MAG: HAD-IA family hydrolase [Gammaproteobacteria bacterium]|nr:HAD-IA family hydrolase [Gammaproteobacteria bacterium]
MACHLFETMACGDEVKSRKPAPDLILKALENMDVEPDHSCWYVGDSTTDIVAAATAGVTPIFYNGAQWEQDWIDHIFPGTVRHPHRPEAVVNSFAELTELVRQLCGAWVLALNPREKAVLPRTVIRTCLMNDTSHIKGRPLNRHYERVSNLVNEILISYEFAVLPATLRSPSLR